MLKFAARQFNIFSSAASFNDRFTKYNRSRQIGRIGWFAAAAWFSVGIYPGGYHFCEPGIRFHLALEVDAVLAKDQSGDTGVSQGNTYTLRKAEASGKIQLVALVQGSKSEQTVEFSQDPSGLQIVAVQKLINQAVAGMIEVIKNKRKPSDVARTLAESPA